MPTAQAAYESSVGRAVRFFADGRAVAMLASFLHYMYSSSTRRARRTMVRRVSTFWAFLLTSTFYIWQFTSKLPDFLQPYSSSHSLHSEVQSATCTHCSARACGRVESRVSTFETSKSYLRDLKVIPPRLSHEYFAMNPLWNSPIRVITPSISFSGGRKVVRKCHVPCFWPKPEPGTTTIPVASRSARA